MNDKAEIRPSESDEETQEPDLDGLAQNTSRKLLTLLAVAAVLFIAIQTTPLGQQVRDWDTLAEVFKARGPQAVFYFVLASAFLILAGAPRLMFFTLGGFAFGFWEGMLWSLCASMIGSFAAFRAARWGGRQWLTERFGQRRFFARIVHAQPTVASVALIRLLPVSNVIINVGLALSRVGNRVFLLGSLIGFVPQGAIAVIIGSGIAQDVPMAGATQIIAAAAVVLAILIHAGKRRRN